MAPLYPAVCYYYFSTDLDITEDLIPFVNVSILTKAIENQDISFYFPNRDLTDRERELFKKRWQAFSSDEAEILTTAERDELLATSELITAKYNNFWYIYGEGDLIYAGEGGYVGYDPYIRKWQGKYFNPVIYPGSYGEACWDSDYEYRLYWSGSYFNRYLQFPAIGYYSDSPTPDPDVHLPYSTVDIKLNTGMTRSQAQAINPDYAYQLYDDEQDLDFPHMLRSLDYVWHEDCNIKKVWIQLNEEKTKYRLTVYGELFKYIFTHQENIIYDIKQFHYVETVESEWDSMHGKYHHVHYYNLTSSSITTGTITRYVPNEDDLDKVDIKLLVSYLNHQNFTEQIILKNRI